MTNSNTGGRAFNEFLNDRKTALLSMDKAVIEKYCAKYGISLPKDEATFWCAIHKARTADLLLPLEERMKSKRWLTERNYESMDDGDLAEKRRREGKDER